MIIKYILLLSLSLPVFLLVGCNQGAGTGSDSTSVKESIEKTEDPEASSQINQKEISEKKSNKDELKRGTGLPETVGKVKTIELTGLDGEALFPFQNSEAKAITFLFVCTDCPVACRYVPELNRIHEDYSKKGIQFWLVYADDRESNKTIKAHLKEYQHKMSACSDFGQELMELTKASVTPEAVVFNSKGELVYRGRIDNRFHDFGETRAKATKHELRDALDAILEDRDITVSKTKAVGCFIPKKS